MQETAITLVGGDHAGLGDAIVQAAAAAIKGIANTALRVEVLHPNKATDLIIPARNAELNRQIYQKLQNTGGFDIFVQPVTPARRKKLLVADMDATMIEGETLDELAAHAGLKEKVAAITARAMAGEIDFADALTERVGLLKNLPLSKLNDVIAATRLNHGAEIVIKTMRRHGARCVLVSGGFDMFTGHVAQQAGFHAHHGNRLHVEGDRLCGTYALPIVDKDRKKKILLDEARTLGITPDDVIAVGDGANDIPMLQTAGVGVGYHGKAAVQAATPYQIRHSDLTALLYLQGYRKEEIAL